MPLPTARRISVLLFSALFSLAVLNPKPPLLAETPSPSVPLEAGKILRLFPAGDVFPVYEADLHRPRFGIVFMTVPDIGIAASGDTRFDLRLGGRFGVLRVHPEGRPDLGWQVSILAGFDGQFDVDKGYDSIGWDGNYGLAFTRAWPSGWALKTRLYHTSSHIGDEYAERTGRRRIGYTREEADIGAAWRRGRVLVYAETGWGYDLRNEELQEPGRGQLGFEYRADDSLWAERLGWFAALDLSATEERDFRLDVSFLAGLSLRSGARRWRAALGYADGRPPLGEFFQDTEQTLSLGLWLDL